jgi:hypothetical protein
MNFDGDIQRIWRFMAMIGRHTGGIAKGQYIGQKLLES